MRETCFEFVPRPPAPAVLVPPPENVHHGQNNSAYRWRIIETVARTCGCNNEKDVRDFADAEPEIRNPMGKLPAWKQALARLCQARDAGEKIVVYGDYDCDGVTSTVLMLEGLAAIGIKAGWFIPNRFDHGYGVSDAALELCVRLHQPDLLIAVDCGTNSRKELKELRDGGYGGRQVESVVIDHHHIAEPLADEPGLIVLNPTSLTEDDANRGVQKMCAAGLVYLFWEAAFAELRCPPWNRQRALILAGLATQADVVPLMHINRALVKNAIRELANGGIKSVLGLWSLHRQLHRKQIRKGNKKLPPVNEETFGFKWGPCLNACGRLDDAHAAVELLRVQDPREAIRLARECDTMNRRRINTHRRILAEADEQARAQVLDQNKAKVILAAAPHWNIGVVGIVAARLREKYMRPAFVCGKDKAGHWCGSGRSVPKYDIGKNLALASPRKKTGIVNGDVSQQGQVTTKPEDAEPDQTPLILKGGGHPMAGGLRFTEEQRPKFAAWLNEQCSLTENDFRAGCEILAPAEAMTVSQWRQLIRGLQPFGRDNPWRPILACNVKLDAVKALPNKNGHGDDADDAACAYAGYFTAGNGKRFRANWWKHDRAKAEWTRGRYYTLELDFPVQPSKHHTDLPYQEPFYVIDCWPEPG